MECPSRGFFLEGDDKATKSNEETETRQQKNAAKKARQFNFETMFMEARQSALTRTAEISGKESTKETIDDDRRLCQEQIESSGESHHVCFYLSAYSFICTFTIP